MSRHLSIAVLACVFVSGYQAGSSEFYVDSSVAEANDGNPGTEARPWRTLQHAANALRAGDTVCVRSGTYDERVKVRNSGQKNSPITFVADRVNGPVLVRGFAVDSKQYIRIIGFEITHTPASRHSGIELRSANGSELLDNYIHHTHGVGIWLPANSPSDNVVIRGNRISYTGSVSGRQVGEVAVFLTGNRNVAEYNDISHVADFFNMWGRLNVLRNNYLHDCTLADYPDFKNPQGHHIDGLQYYSAADTPLTRNLMERNYFARNEVPHAHVVILRDTRDHGSAEFLFRGNVVAQNGSYAFIIDRFDHFRAYNNTFVNIGSVKSPKPRYCIGFTDGATGGKLINNIFADSASSMGSLYMVDAASKSGFYADYNLIHSLGRPSERNLVHAPPGFANAGADDFHLEVKSPAIDSGGPLTITTSAGIGAVVSVESAAYFTDGWSVTDGDEIIIGTNAPVRVLAIDEADNRLTVERAIAWPARAWVNLSFEGNLPDRGAFEYRASGYDYSISITNRTSEANVDEIVIDANVTNPACVRHVIFHVNSVPIAKFNRAPYRFTWKMRTDERCVVEARAYANYAASNLTQSAVLTIPSPRPSSAQTKR